MMTKVESALLRTLARRTIEKSALDEWTVVSPDLIALRLPDTPHRIHIFDQPPGISSHTQIHSHQEGFWSTILSGKMVQRRHFVESEVSHLNARANYIRVGVDYQTSHAGLVDCVSLVRSIEETYEPGQQYHMYAEEIHSADPVAGTVTMLQRVEADPPKFQYSFLPFTEDKWAVINAASRELPPRPTHAERADAIKRHLIDLALERWDHDA